ncbi:MAG: hypothetical protein J6386_22700 [Candidatus Synoicihabitans palmerolidicus]|nr:hypothetical protein [Candidatus Synoicihabitans palmerolidicus]
MVSDPLARGWLPSRRLAYVFRAFASYDKAVATSELRPVQSAVRGGTTLTYGLTGVEGGWTRIAYYEGDTLVREVTPEDENPLRATMVAERGGFAVMHAVVTLASGEQRTSMPRRRMVMPVVKEEPPPELPELGAMTGPSTVKRGDAFELAVAVEIRPEVTYEWTRSGKLVTGSEGPTLVVPVALAAHAGA